MATVLVRKLYDKAIPVTPPAGAVGAFGGARLYAFAEFVADAAAGQQNAITTHYGIAVDAADPPAKFIELERSEFDMLCRLKGLAIP